MNVGTVVKESTIRFVSSTEAPRPEPRDFVGKALGISSEGGESETTLDLVLATSGIDPASVERQVVGVGPGVSQMPNVVVLSPGEFIESGAQLYMVSTDGQVEAGHDSSRWFTNEFAPVR